jgi:hypothetical protein
MPPLIRYFSELNARAFVERGEVLFRSLSYFRDYEDQGVRADEHEGTLVHLPSDGLRITRVDTGELIALPHRLESTAREDDIFVYCLSTELSDAIAERFQAEVAVEVVEPSKFLARVRSALSLRSRIRSDELVYQPVRYYEWHEPPIVDWALPERIAMRKPKLFEWQREFRFAVPVGEAFQVENVSVKLVPLNFPRIHRTTQHPEMLLKLGNLSKICRVHRL